MLYMDILSTMSETGFTRGTTFSSYLLVVDRYSCGPFLRGLPDKSSIAVTDVVEEF
jgi:hypothetical protein